MLAQNVRGLCKAARRFSKARAGSAMVVFAASILPLMGVIGLAVDYSHASRLNSRVRSIADAAALAGVRRTADSYLAYSVQYDLSHGNYINRGIGEANSFVESQKSSYPDLSGMSYSVRIERSGEQFTAFVDYALVVPSRIMSVLGLNQLDVAGTVQSTVGAAVTSYVDFFVLLDNSASMGIGATPLDISRMQALNGCAFACHDPASKPTYHDIPKANGVKFRLDVLKDATTRMLDTARSAAGPVGQIRVGLFSFQSAVGVVSELSTNYIDLKSRVSSISLPSTISTGTRIRQSLAWMNANRVTASGQGIDAATPRKFVLLVTDGVEDIVNLPPSTPDYPSPRGTGGLTGAIDSSSCDALKAKGVTVGVLYTTYTPFPGDVHYDGRIAPFAGNIANNLRSCASDGYFFEAATPAEIDGGMQKLLQKAIISTTTRVSR